LVVAWQHDRTDGSWFTVSPANFLDWQRQTGVFDGLAAIQQFHDVEFSLAEGGSSEAVRGVHVSQDLLRVLRVTPTIGRAFTPEDTELDRDVVILGHDLWVGRFGSDQGIVGRDIRLNGKARRVIGVMPVGFEVPLIRAQLYLPLAWTAAQRQERRIANYLVLGRLREGVSLRRAAADLEAVAQALAREYPATNKDLGVLLDPLHEQVVGDVRPSLLVMLTAAGGVLLLACFNLATLLSARGVKREPELAVRTALGASRWRVLRQLLTEGLLIALLGGLAGVASGAAAIRAFVGLFNDTRYFSLPRRAEIGIDWRVFACVGLVCVMAAVLFSVGPAMQAMKADIVAGIRPVGGRRDTRWRRVLMAAELAVSLMLVVASGLLVRSYLRLHGERPGFSSTGVLTTRIALPDERYRTADQREVFFRSVIDEVRRLPSVSGAAAVQLLPLGGIGSVWSISIPDRPGETVPSPFHFIVSPGYFETMQIPLVAGRPFNEQDTTGRRRVAIVSQAAAQRYFPAESPIGRTLRIEDREPADWEVVGIVGDVRNQRLDRAPKPQVYVPMGQSPVGAMTLVVRTATDDPLTLARPVRDVVRRLDGEQALTELKSLGQVVDDSSARWRVSTFLVLGFGAVSLILALIGLGGVTSYTVAQRTREIALRLALGDSRMGIVRLILRSLAAVAATGVILGLVLALVMSRALSSLLYGVSPADPIILTSAALAFVGMVLITGIVSASKGSNLDPMAALKAE
jgi:putative ABC transport system permease protein